MRISVFGLGKLGAPLAVALAHRGFEVVGYDVERCVVERLDQGEAPVDEPDLDRLLGESGGRLSATSDPGVAVDGSEVTFLVVPTPSEANGAFSTRFALEAADDIGRALRGKDDWHLTVLTSTVMPGATGGELVPRLEAASGKRCGEGFGVCYSPEFIALGSVVRDLLRPDFVLIGESDERSGKTLASIYERLCENSPPVMRMNFVNAEVAKIAVNTFVTTKISYANMLAELCERLPGGDVGIVTEAIGLDHRIGRAYLQGALGYGGPCFPRDNIALAKSIRDAGAHADLPEATDRVNRRQVGRVVDRVLAFLPPGGHVGVLGLSYKPDTRVVEESQGLEIARELAARGVAVTVHDPKALDAARVVLGEAVSYASTPTECLARCDVAVVATGWDAFRSLSDDDLPDDARLRAVVDCWRILDPRAFQDEVEIVHLGRGA